MAAQDTSASSANLSSLLREYGLYDVYHSKLVHQGFGSLELLAHVSEADVDQLCAQLDFPLVDKLRFKQALKSGANIPRDAVTYAIINQVEQMAIIEIDHSIRKAESLIIGPRNADVDEHTQMEQALNREKERVMALFDEIRLKLNQKLQRVLTEIEEQFERSCNKSYRQQLTQYLDDAKHIQQQCQTLIIGKAGCMPIDARNQSVVQLKNECCAKLEQLTAGKPELSVCVDEAVMQQLVRSIEGVVKVQVLPSKHRHPQQQTQSFSDSNGARASLGRRRSQENKENVDASNSTTTTQWAVNTAAQTFANIGHGESGGGGGGGSTRKGESEFGNIDWQFDTASNQDTVAAAAAPPVSKAEPFGSFDEEPVFDLEKHSRSKTSLVAPPKPVAANAAKVNDDENCSQITFKPIIALDEQTVDTGHEREELLRSFAIKSLYFWGKDVTGQNMWKLRASQTELCFYLNKSTRKARIICRECKTAKLRLNHFIPSPDISRMNCKNNRLVIWFAFDTTMGDGDAKIEGDYATFCAKFSDAAAANEFVHYFEKYGNGSQSQS